MEPKKLLEFVGFFVIAFSLVMPAYADVLTFKTDKTFYGKTSTIEFSGTVEEDDYGELVTIIIENPVGEFVKLVSVFPDADNKFQDSLKIEEWYDGAGIYNATAFIVNKTNGIVIDFDIEKQRPVIVQEPKPEPEQESTPTPTPIADQESETQEGEKSIQEKIKERIEAVKKQKEALKNQTTVTSDVVNQTSNSPTIQNDTITSSDPDKTENKSNTSGLEIVQSDSNSMLYVVIGIGSAGAVGAVVYGMKNKTRHKADYSSYFKTTEPESVQKPATKSEDDYALMILKNRLAKGEITVDEFNELKKALKEP